MPKGSNTKDIEFANSYDHEGYTRGMLQSEAIPFIHFEVLEPGPPGTECMMNDWATVHYKTYNKEDLKSPPKVSDKEVYAQGTKLFLVGNYQVSKCWDIAIQMLRPGDTGRFTCPSKIDNGGSRENYKQNSNEWIPEGTDLTYEFKVD